MRKLSIDARLAAGVLSQQQSNAIANLINLSVSASADPANSMKYYFNLSWIGGKAPFRVSVNIPSVVTLTTSTSSRSQTLSYTFARTGQYQANAEVSDADGRRVTGATTVTVSSTGGSTQPKVTEAIGTKTSETSPQNAADNFINRYTQAASGSGVSLVGLAGAATSAVQQAAQQVSTTVTPQTPATPPAPGTVKPRIELTRVAESAIVAGGKTDVIRGIKAELLYNTASGREVRKTDVNLEISISGPVSRTTSIRAGETLDLRDLPPGTYTISARWPGGVSNWLVEPVPGLLGGPVPLPSEPAVRTITVTIGGSQTSTGGPTVNQEAEARRRYDSLQQAVRNLDNRFKEIKRIYTNWSIAEMGACRVVARGGIFVDDLTRYVAYLRGEPSAVRYVNENQANLSRYPAVGIDGGTIDSIFRDANSLEARLIPALYTYVNDVSRNITAGAYASAIKVYDDAQAKLSEGYTIISRLENAVNTVERNMSFPPRSNCSAAAPQPPIIQVSTQQQAQQGGQLATASASAGSASTTTAGLSQSKSELMSKINQARTQLNSVLNEINRLRSAIPSLEGLITSLNARRDELVRQMSSARDRLNRLEAGAQIRAEELKSRIDSARSQLTTLIAQRDRLKADRDQLRSRLESLRASFSPIGG